MFPSPAGRDQVLVFTRPPSRDPTRNSSRGLQDYRSSLQRAMGSGSGEARSIPKPGSILKGYLSVNRTSACKTSRKSRVQAGV